MYQRLCDVLNNLHAPYTENEMDLHQLVSNALQAESLPFEHEASLGSRCRIDFLVGTVGIEIKKGRPNASQLYSQLLRYAQSDKITHLIVIAEKEPPLPSMIYGKSVLVISLQKLWGIQLAGQKIPLATAKPIAQANEEANEEVSTEKTLPQSPCFPPSAMSEPLFDDNSKGEETAVTFNNPSLSEIPLPDYLKQPTNVQHYYGQLSYNRKAKCWTIKGELGVTQMCKRLFPGVSGSKRGEARFTNHQRMVLDICWLMLRYPLKVAPLDEVKWRETVENAKKYYQQKQLIRLAPQRISPSKTHFSGELKPFQEEGLSFLLHTKRALLADEMGLGKTVQALCALSMQRLYPTLVIVPAHLVNNWQREIARFVKKDGQEVKVHVIKGLTPYPLEPADIYIVHYLLLRGWKKALTQYEFRLVLFDEIQELRHGGTEKYSAASLLSSNCETVYGLSGTPIYNYGGEIWNVINILDFHFLGSFDSFSREWCNGYGNNIVIKPDQLGQFLRNEGIMLRRTKEEVLSELPPKRRLVQEIDVDDALYKNLLVPVMTKMETWLHGESLSKAQRALLEEEISRKERQATGLAKAPYVAQFVRTLLEADEKILLFAHHHGVMDAYKKELKAYKPVFITGRETSDQKQNSVDAFTSGKTNLCVISLRSASGLNLQQATAVVFGELDWSPAVHSQAEDRAHRIGHKDSLLCYYLVAPKGSDHIMQETLGLKVSQFLSLMGDAPLSEEVVQENATFARKHVEELLGRLQL